jgi:retron-type reverse transcriptase
MSDRARQSLWKLALEPVAETRAEPNSYGFWPARSTADAIGQCFTVLARRASAEWVLQGDIRGWFDTIRHAVLLHKIAKRVHDPQVLHLVKQVSEESSGFRKEARSVHWPRISI